VRFRLALLCAAAVAVGTFLSPAGTNIRAEDGHDAGPTEITADTLEWNDEAAVATAIGNAVARQTGRTLRAEQFVAHAVRAEDGSVGQIGLIEATGGVVYETAVERARGDAGHYDLVAGVITLIGEVELERDGNLLRGAILTIDLVNGTSQVTGAGDERPSLQFGNADDEDAAQ
jgi:lipopolysaccharide transport protein LptA